MELTIAIVFWTNVGDSSGAVKQISPLLSLQADQSEFDGVIIIAPESLKNAVDSDAGEADEAIINFYFLIFNSRTHGLITLTKFAALLSAIAKSVASTKLSPVRSVFT